MTEPAFAQTLRVRARELNDQVRTRAEQLNQEARTLYTKAEGRLEELLAANTQLQNTLTNLRDNGEKLQQKALEIGKREQERLQQLGEQLLAQLGLATRARLEALEKKVVTLGNKIKKLEKPSKAA